MRAIDANKIEYGYLWKKKDGTVHSPAFAFKEDIDKQPELPTMQSNDICRYCKNHTKKECRRLETYHRCFEGKRIIEVE